MFQCINCQGKLLQRDLRFYQGDWIIKCVDCGALNILGHILTDEAKRIAKWQVVGYRD